MRIDIAQVLALNYRRAKANALVPFEYIKDVLNMAIEDDKKIRNLLSENSIKETIKEILEVVIKFNTSTIKMYNLLAKSVNSLEDLFNMIIKHVDYDLYQIELSEEDEKDYCYALSIKEIYLESAKFSEFYVEMISKYISILRLAKLNNVADKVEELINVFQDTIIPNYKVAAADFGEILLNFSCYDKSNPIKFKKFPLTNLRKIQNISISDGHITYESDSQQSK